MLANQIKTKNDETTFAAEKPDTAVQDVKIEVFESFDAAAIIEPEWDAFIEAGGGEIFLTYDWCRIWWKHYGKNRKLRIYTFRSAGALVGILPMFYEVIWLGPVYVKVVKIVGADFTLAQIRLPVQTAFLPKIMEIFFREVCSTFSPDIICLGPLAGQYGDLNILHLTCDRLLSDRWVVAKESSGVQTYFELANDWEKHLTALNKRERQDIRRNYNVVAKSLGAEGCEVCGQKAANETFDRMFTDFVAMHQSQWEEFGKLGHFGDWPGSEAFHREAAQAQLCHDRLRLLEIRVGDYCLGYEYIYKIGKTYCNFLAARSALKQPQGISFGKLSYGEMMKMAIAEGINCVDSLQGKYEYKLRLGGQLFDINKICISRKNFTARIRIAMFRLFAKILNFYYYRIWYCRMAQRLPIKRRSLWKIWIRTKGLI